MPGIVGLVTRRPREHAERELLRMVHVLDHERFYTVGTWTDESLGLYVGWIARKDSFDDGMPLMNERGDVLVFSGEEFPEPATRRDLRASGHSVDDDGPGYLVHLYETDPNFLTRLNGRFHGVLADRTQASATLFTDRYGLHRLYYHAAPDTFYFAAEVKAILAACPELRRIDAHALGEFIACGCVMEGRTLFPDVHVVPPAAAWTFRSGALECRRRYFRPEEWESESRLEPAAFYDELRRVISCKVPRYFEGREAVGVSLTGGLDTRVVMACRGPHVGAVRCYTFGGMFRDSHDVRVARKVAAACGSPYDVLRIDGEFLSRFAHYAERAVYLTDGCADVSHAADLYANEWARTIAPVRLTGNYGGEILRTVAAFRPEVPRAGLFDEEIWPGVRRAETIFAQARARHPVSFAAFHQAPWHHYGLLALEETQVALRSPFLDNDVVRTSFRAPTSALATTEICGRLIADESPALARIRTDRGPRDDDDRLVARIARMAITTQRKAEYAYDYGMPQWLASLDRAVAPLHLERLVLGRHKFYHFRVWYRDVLAAYVQDVLLDPRALGRPYVNARSVEAVVRGHVTGAGNYTSEIHKLLTLELLHRLFVDR